jgi:hypothetical protein
MARDLIPPLSPAGRPAPDGITHLDSGSGGTPNLIELPPEPARSPSQPVQAPAPAPSEFRNRFGFLIGALGGVFIAAVLVLVVVVSTNGGGNGVDEGLAPNWSAWQPSDKSLEGGAAEIANKVGAEYRHPDGKQLALVTGAPLDANVALRAASGTITVIDDPGVLYRLDGLGPNGSILGGKASTDRLKVVHREALELALYTFRYLPDVKQVVTLLPSPPPTPEEIKATNAAKTATLVAQEAAAKANKTGKPADVAAAQAAIAAAEKASTTSTPDPVRNAVFYRPGDLQQQLQMPLGMTLPAKAPTTETLSDQEAATIDLLTLSNVFKWSLPNPNSPLLVLDR